MSEPSYRPQSEYNQSQAAQKLGNLTQAKLELLVQGVAGGYKLARGTATLDGSNPTTVATGLATIVTAVCSLKAASTPGDDPSWVSVNYSGSDGNLDIYAYK